MEKMMLRAETIPGCRSCGCKELRPFLDLGETPLANSLVKPSELNEPEATFPLRAAFCPECSLVQLLETVPPEAMFRSYVYFSSFSDTMVRHAKDLAHRVTNEDQLGREHLVIEAASNDGYLLQHYRDLGVQVLGIEPAQEAAAVAREQRKIDTIEEFFNAELAEQLAESGIRADVFHAHNVLAHNPDINTFVAGIATILKPNGRAIVEVPYAKEMIEKCEFDTVYHEHFNYFSLTALHHLVNRHGMHLYDVKEIAIHGGTLQIHFGKAPRPMGEAASTMLKHEERIGMTRFAYYERFGERVDTLKANLVRECRKLKEAGKRIAAYGASAKGSTLLHYCELGGETIDYVVDRSTVKQGLYTPGKHLHIHEPSKLVETMPDYVLLLTWNFEAEILQQQNAYRERGGKFLVPVPELRVA